MAIKLKCNCGAGLSVGDEFAGKKVKCPKCKTILNVPAGGSSVAEVAASTPATPPPPPPPPQAVEAVPVAEVAPSAPPTPPAEPVEDAKEEPGIKKSSISSRSGRGAADKKEKTSVRGEGRSGRSEGAEKTERGGRGGRSRDEKPGNTKLYVIIGSVVTCLILVAVIFVLQSGKPGAVDSDIQSVINGFFAAGSSEKAKQYITYGEAINETMYRRQSKNGGKVTKFISQTAKGDVVTVKAKLFIQGNPSQNVEIGLKKVGGAWKIDTVD